MLKKYKGLWITLIIVIPVLLIGLRYALDYAYIGSSYGAKITCSCYFVSKRDLSSIQSEDLYAVPFIHIDIDTNLQTVSADIYGFAKTKAIYRPGLGCTLLNEATAGELMAQSTPVPHASQSDTIFNKIAMPANIDSTSLLRIVEGAFLEKDTSMITRTRAVVILHDGRPIVEKYAEGITAETPLMGWSMTKSVTNAMIGLLVKDGKLKVDDPAPINEWKSDERKNITLDHLMRMSSGLDFEENYTSPSDATRMLFRKKGAGAYALQSKLKNDPGTVWYYSSGTTNILQLLIRRQFSNLEDYQAFPNIRLFDIIGMTSAVIEPDASGTFVGSSYMYATARDWARFGLLYLQDGVWQGERILPEGWVHYSSTETPHSNGRYAAQFWINHQDKDFPQDAFFADGFEGQFVVIIPSKKLVIVRLGCTQGGGFDISDFVKKIVGTLPS